MRGGKVRKLAVLVLIGAAVAALLKKLRGDPAPQFSNHPTVSGGPAVDPVLQPDPVAKAAPVDPTVPRPDADTHLVPAPVDPTVPEPDPVATDTEPEAPAADDEAAIDSEQAWVEPVDGACPDGYPVKAKVSSGIFHQPGGAAYDRTNPDRCYPSAAAAEADGLRAAKR